MDPSLTRRRFLLAGGGALALAACGGGSSKTGSASSSSSSTTTTNGASSPFNLVGFYAADALGVGQPQRLPVGLADAQGAFLPTSPVPSLTFTVVDAQGTVVSQPQSVNAHTDGLTRPYFPVIFTPPAPGIYAMNTTVQGTPVSKAVQIPTSTTVPAAGQAMIPFDTPTVTDPKGVELLCTHTPARCPLHDVTLTQAVAEKRPIAFLIATPAYCQTAICGPVLDLVLAAQPQFPTVRFLHSEVYPTVAAAQPGAQQVVPVVTAYRLSFEPALFLATPDGKIQNRLDTIFDRAELHDALTRLVS